jgi:beta-glucanase (GH16 family)
LVLLGLGGCGPVGEIPVEGYALVWADEFDGGELDMGKWGYRQLGLRRDGVNVAESVSLDGRGHLVLTTRQVGDEYHTAMIGTEETFQATYGYFECRAKLQEQVGHWSAFWLQSPTIGQPVGDPGAAGVEADIFEYLRRNGEEVVHNLHWDGYGDHHRSAGGRAEVAGLGEGWHTFGVEWTAEGYVFFVDGVETWRSAAAISRRAQYMILSLEVGPWAGKIAEATLPDSLLVDYVRVYQRAE